jgi:hypothetical protein
MTPALSPWIILPLALACMLIVSAHVTITQTSEAPPSRKRVRMANGWVMLLTLPLLAAGVSLIAPERDPRLFVLTWTTVVFLVGLSVALAVIDAINTLRLVRRERRRHVDELLERRRAERTGDPAPEHHGGGR